MTQQTSRSDRDVHPQTSVSDRDVSAKRHAHAVTFEREPLLSFCSRSQAVSAWLELTHRLDLLLETGQRTACQADPAPFVSEELHDRRAALKACAHCPVLDPCRDYAEANDEPWHVWGGQDRPAVRRRQARKATA